MRSTERRGVPQWPGAMQLRLGRVRVHGAVQESSKSDIDIHTLLIISLYIAPLAKTDNKHLLELQSTHVQ